MADFWSGYFAKRDGAQAGTQAQQLHEDGWIKPGYGVGWLGSAVSSVGEMFGAQPAEDVQTFRNENPLGGFTSILAGGIGPYGLMGKLSSTARGAAMLEEGMAAIPGVRALSMAQTPVRYTMAREVLRYSPLELSRLGVGLATTEDWDDYGNLLADVGLSTALTGGFGGIIGFFQRSGKALPEAGRVVGTDHAFLPTFELRMLNEQKKLGTAQVTGDLSPDELGTDLLRRVFTDAPAPSPVQGVKSRYVDALENGSPEADALVNSLFKPSGVANKALVKQPLMNRNTGLWNLDDTAREELLAATGFKSMDEVAETLVYPRVITVASERAAGALGKIMDDAPLMYVGDGVMMAREADSGLFVVAKRTKAGAVADAPVDAVAAPTRPVFGTSKIGEGDQWLIGKTDQPQRLVPEAHKVAELNVAQWAKYRDPYKPSKSTDMFNQSANMLNEILSPKDWKAIQKGTSGSAVQTITDKLVESVNSGKLSQVFPGMQGIKDAAALRSIAQEMYTVVKPAMFLENQSTLYQRLFAHLRNNIQTGESLLSKVVHGGARVTGSPLRKKNISFGPGFNGNRSLQEIVHSLDHDEIQLVAKAAMSQTPAEELAKLSANGLISQKATDAVTELQRINADVWEQAMLPAMKAAGVGKEFDLLEGYIMPRIFKGDWFVPVQDGGGNMVWLAAGTPRQAKAEAAAVLEAAKAKGLNWTMGEGRATHLSKVDADTASHISELVSLQQAKNADTAEIVQTAMRSLEAKRAGNSRVSQLRDIGPPGTLANKRTGLGGSPDLAEYTADDLVQAMEGHYRQMLRFAGYHTWRERWLPEANNLSKMEPALYRDLQRKGNQVMGIEGQITNTLNKTLEPVLGAHLGGKAATRIAQATNSLMYSWNLAIANPTFALLNLLTPLNTVAPMISYVTRAPAEAVERLMHTTVRYGADGRIAGTFSSLHPMKVLAQSLKELKSPDEALKEGFSRAVSDGTLTPQLFEGWVGGQSRAHQTLREAYESKGGGLAGGWEFIKRTSTFMAEKSEEVSRMNAFTASWILGRDGLQLTGEQLYKFAQRGTHVSMYGYSVVDRSRMFTGPVGSMFGLFKNWQFHFIGQMGQYAGLSMRGGSFEPMLWQGASALALGGLGATPLKYMADGLARWQGDSPSSFLWMKENWEDNEKAGDAIYFGLPALLGASLQGSSTMPGTDVRNDLANMGNFVFLERAKAVGAAIGDSIDYWNGTGQNPLYDPNIRDKILQATAPRAVFRAFAATEGEYIKSMKTGYPMVRDIPQSSRVLHALGFNQVDVEEQQVAGKELWKNEERQRLLIANLGIAFADAQLNNDRDDMTRIINRAVALGVDHTKVVKSAHTRMRREQGDAMDRYGKTPLSARYARAFEDK